MIASSAFELGVDIPDIASNWGLPHSLEDLVQETGRAGRNGSQAQVILYCRRSAMKASKPVHKNMRRTNLCVIDTRNFYICNSCKNPVSSCQCCHLCGPMCQCFHCTKFQ